MNSSKPGAEKTATARMSSFPILSTEIHVSAGMNTVEPPWTTLAAFPKCTRAVPLSKNRISSPLGCLWGSMAPPLRMFAVINTKCDEPPFLGSTFRMKVSPGSGCPGQPLTTRRSPSSFSRMSGVVWETWAACGDDASGAEMFAHTKIAQTAILGRTIRIRWLPKIDARKSLVRVTLQFKLAKHLDFTQNPLQQLSGHANVDPDVVRSRDDLGCKPDNRQPQGNHLISDVDFLSNQQVRCRK